MKKDKIILTDIDGVVLDWEEGFNVWMQHHGHNLTEGYQYVYDVGTRYGITKQTSRSLIKQFNESAAIGFLPPLRDAQWYINLLHEKYGYKFIAITSLSLDEEIRCADLPPLKCHFKPIDLRVSSSMHPTQRTTWGQWCNRRECSRP